MDEKEVITKGPISGDDGGEYLIKYVIPEVLIVVGILLALLIACLLTKKHSNKSLTRSSEQAQTLVKKRKGVPVIFQEELEEDEEARSRSPALLQEEHRPLPPEYRRVPIQQYQPASPMIRIEGSYRGVHPGANYDNPPPYSP